jgi:hypothetical protein
MRIRSVCAAIFGLLICQATPVSATVYNIDIFGSLPDGVTRDPSGTASTNACSATTCAGGWNTAYSFYAQPGDTINFGSLVLSSFIFGDGRQYSPRNTLMKMVNFNGRTVLRRRYTRVVWLSQKFIGHFSSSIAVGMVFATRASQVVFHSRSPA